MHPTTSPVAASVRDPARPGHLRELPGMDGVISGMRSDAELHIWVDVHRALREGVRFFEATNGVILCDGNDSDGVLPAKYFSKVIDVKDGANLLEGTRWNLVDWLNGLNRLNPPIAGALLARADSAHMTEEQQLNALRDIAKLGPVQSRGEVLRRLVTGGVLHQMAKVIADACQDLIADSPQFGSDGLALTGFQLHERFVTASEDRPIDLALSGSELFYGGLSGLVGKPQPNLAAAIRHEHCSSLDSADFFVAKNYGTKTSSRVEYWFVFDPMNGLEELSIKSWPTEALFEDHDMIGSARPPSRAMPRQAKPFAAFTDKLREKNFALQSI
eukprot:7380439-Prymnesium_polylepis.1